MKSLSLLLLVAATPVACRAQLIDSVAGSESDSLTALKWVTGVWVGSVTRHYNPGAWQATFESIPVSGNYLVRYVRVENAELACEGTASVREILGSRSILFEQHLVSDDCLSFNDGGLIHEFARLSLSAVRSSPDSAYVQINFSGSGRLEASGLWKRQGR